MKTTLPLLLAGVLLFLTACREQPKDIPEVRPDPVAELTAAEYAQLSQKKLYVDWEYTAAKDALLKAVELNPNDALSYANLAWYWMLEENKAASLKAIEKARAAAPDNALWAQWHGWLCYFYDEFDCAEKELKASIAMQPQQRDAYFTLGRMHYRNGNTKEALKWLDRAAQDSTGRVARAMYWIINGDTAKARDLVNEIKAQPESFERMVLVPLQDMLGERDSALTWLEQNYKLRQPLLPWLRFMPIMRPFHGDPRFEAVVEKIGKPEI
ncbi:tetratricopeptide repeat protein [Robiginitalea sp. IMCC43444]|uniref:tetratricopeptide repeat protein n=1 Tax=Robiginitalea sp. IMCC43444 TaxID=3459121 RepID=UPI0040417ABD